MQVPAAKSPLKIDLEERITAAGLNKMRFFLRSPLNAVDNDKLSLDYFPEGCSLSAVPDAPALSPWPWTLFDDPFVEVSTQVDALRASYLAPCVHLNMYVDWLVFDQECERGLHDPAWNEGRPSNIARRSHLEVAVHSILISIKSGLDRLISVAALYLPGVAPHMTWGRIEDGKSSNFMSVVERGRGADELLDYLFKEYKEWISTVVAPRDDIIHYADLLTTWHFQSGEEGPRLAPGHTSPRHDQAPTFDAHALSAHVRAFYALADRFFLTLATRIPRAISILIQPPRSGLGAAIMDAFGIPESPRIGELIRAVNEAIKNGAVAAAQPPEVYVAFLRQHAARFGVPEEAPELFSPDVKTAQDIKTEHTTGAASLGMNSPATSHERASDTEQDPSS